MAVLVWFLEDPPPPRWTVHGAALGMTAPEVAARWLMPAVADLRPRQGYVFTDAEGHRREVRLGPDGRAILLVGSRIERDKIRQARAGDVFYGERTVWVTDGTATVQVEVMGRVCSVTLRATPGR